MVHIDIDSTITDKFYTMNPATEDVIRGSKLEEGMIVLIEDSILKGDPERAFKNDPSGFGTKRVLEVNRWCKVTDLEVENGIVSFIGLYHDGTKHPRLYNQCYCWFVKKDSIPTKEVPLPDQEKELLQVGKEIELRRKVDILRAKAHGVQDVMPSTSVMYAAAADLLEVHIRGGISLENFNKVGNFVNIMLRRADERPYTPNGA